MKTKLLISAVLLTLLVVDSVALAGGKKFKDFTVSVPESCKAEEKGDMLTVTCHDNTFFALTIRPSGTLKGRAAADALARQYKGNTPMLNDYGNYFFDTEQNGISYKVELIERNGLLLLYMSDNNPDGWPEALSRAFDSITGNTPATDAFIKEYLLGPPDAQP